jgi:DNA adenine methylase
VRYPGSKRLLAKAILAEILERRGTRTTYIEPFLGGANSFAVIAPHFTRAVGIEANLDVALMWQAVKAGWTPPDTISEAEYKALRDHGTPSAMRGFAGIGSSFGGRFFDGYARNEAGNSDSSTAGQSSRSVEKQRSAIERSLIAFGDYSEAPVTANCVVYCDPPYADTRKYLGPVYEFDSEQFWATAERWHRRGALVLVSEYAAPDGWDVALEIEHSHAMSRKAEFRGTTVEKLFVSA